MAGPDQSHKLPASYQRRSARPLALAATAGPITSGEVISIVRLIVPTSSSPAATLSAGRSVSDGLAARQISTLRYQFPSMEGGSRRPEKPEVAHKAVRAAVQAAADLAPGIPLFADGTSFDGRMTSQAQAETPLANVVGLIFIDCPLHIQGKPAFYRAEHLEQVGIAMLFLHGSRDARQQNRRGDSGERAAAAKRLAAAAFHRLQPEAKAPEPPEFNLEDLEYLEAIAESEQDKRESERAAWRVMQRAPAASVWGRVKQVGREARGSGRG